MIRAPGFIFATLRFLSSFRIFKLLKLSFTSKGQKTATVHRSGAATAAHSRRKMKNRRRVVAMVPTGSGKSKLSINLATRLFLSSEIINSDKIQMYRGMDITTNKISMHNRRGVPHHFLGEFDPDTEFTPAEFRSLASKTTVEIISRWNVPLLVGRSNSFIHALLSNKYNKYDDVFDESVRNPSSPELRYNYCFIWVDVSPPVLNKYLGERRRREDR